MMVIYGENIYLSRLFFFKFKKMDNINSMNENSTLSPCFVLR